MEKVLIALDYDSTSQKVAEIGYSLAKTMKAKVTLLHVIADPLYYNSEHITVLGFAGGLEASQNQVDELLNLKKISSSFLDKTKKHLGDKNIKTLIEEGETAETIIKVASDIQADTIVVGSHSHKWLESIILGSVAEKVLHLTKVPLVIIPTKKAD